MKELYQKWLEEFFLIWKDLSGREAAMMFSADCEYYETPRKACSDWNDILKLWEVVPLNQKNIEYSFDILASTEEMCIVNWKMNRFFVPTEQKQLIDGIFVFSLNTEMKCTFFKQWRYVEVE